MITPMNMLLKPMNSDVRAPLMTSVMTSRWRPPVSPIGCARDGGRPIGTISSGRGMSRKSYGQMNGPKIAIAKRAARIARPTIAMRCFLNFRHASWYWLSDSRPTS